MNFDPTAAKGRLRRVSTLGWSPDEFPSRIDRRTALARCGGLVAGMLFSSQIRADETPARSGLGLVIYDCAIRRKWLQQRDPKIDLFEPSTFLKHCREIGAGGMQASLGVLDAARVKTLREFAAEHRLFVDGIVNSPKDEADVTRFEAEIHTAAEVGVRGKYLIGNLPPSVTVGAICDCASLRIASVTEPKGDFAKVLA
jgi:hypothetical protein